jgi:uncharacterized protein with WD repeat
MQVRRVQRNLAGERYRLLARLMLWSTLLLVLSPIAAQSRPDIRWMSGGHVVSVSAVAFSPDGDYIASAGYYDKTVKIWRVADGQLGHTIAEVGGVHALAFSPDGQFLAVGFEDTGALLQTLRLWRVADGQPVRTFTGQFTVLAVAFSPNGQYLVSGSLDHTTRVWRLSDGTQIRSLSGHANGVNSLCFSPNGRLFAVGRRDASLFVARNPFWQQGDTDGNGCIDDADLLQVLFAFGQTGVNLSADMNEDGIIDDADLLIVLFAFGEGC